MTSELLGLTIAYRGSSNPTRSPHVLWDLDAMVYQLVDRLEVMRPSNRASGLDDIIREDVLAHRVRLHTMISARVGGQSSSSASYVDKNTCSDPSISTITASRDGACCWSLSHRSHDLLKTV